MAKGNTTHGMSYTRLYQTYCNMMRRCYEPNNHKYNNYGARGITVCEDWRNNKESFFKWAEESGYQETLTLDRINVNNGYSPENCRWANPKQQANNKTNNTLLTDKGETHTLSEWSVITGIDRSTISARIKYGWDIHKALTTPVFHTT